MVIVIICAALPAPARAAPQDELKRARNHFEYGEYERAAALVRGLAGQLAAESDLIEAYRILGLAEFYRERPDEARTAFVRLLSYDPDYQMDAFFVPPKAVEFFEGVKKDNQEQLDQIRERKRRGAEERRAQEEAARKLIQEEERRRREREAQARAAAPVVERRVEVHPYVLNWLPLGAGQFQNGDAFKGNLFFAGQLGSAGISAGAFLLIELLRNADTGRFDEGPGNLALGLNVIKFVFGAAFWVLYAWGIVDAHQFWQPHVLVEERTLTTPAEAAAGP